MPKIGIESLYQGYLQNLEAGRNKQTRRPVATQYTEKQPEERNDFDRLCAVIEIMRKALGPNVPFGSESFNIGYYNFSKVRNYETGEISFIGVFEDLWDNLETELDKHKDVVERLKPEEKSAVQAVLDLKAKEREEKEQELEEERKRLFEDLTKDQQPSGNDGKYSEKWAEEERERLKKSEEQLNRLDQKLKQMDEEAATLFGKGRSNGKVEQEPEPERQDAPEVDLNETIQYGDQLDLDEMNETVVLSEDELRKINEELEKKQNEKKQEPTGETQPEANQNEPKNLNETVVLSEDELRKINEELEKKQNEKKREPTGEAQPEAERDEPKAGMDRLYQGYVQNLEAGRNGKTQLPTATQYKEKKPEERNDFDRLCAVIEIMRKALGPNVPFGNDSLKTGYYNISKIRNYEIGKGDFEAAFGDLWENLETELNRHGDVIDRLKPEEKAAVKAVLDVKAKEREPDEQTRRLHEKLTRDLQPKPQPQPEAKRNGLAPPDPTECITAALRQAGMTDKELQALDSSRLVKSRSSEFGRVVDALTSMAAFISHNGNDAAGLRKMIDGVDGLTERCVDYLNKYPKVRSTQSGRDSYDLVLNTLAVFGDPKDARIKACLDGVNKTRGISGRVSNRDYVDLKNYGADRLTGRAKLGSDVLKDIDKELVAQAKLAKKRDAAAREANARLKHLQLKKLYLKALVAPNGVVDPKSLDAQTAELGRNTALNNALAAAAKDPKMQDRIMAAEVNKLRGRRERNEFYEKAPKAPQRKNEDPQRGGPKLGG